jgi:predicted GTPase
MRAEKMGYYKDAVQTWVLPISTSRPWTLRTLVEELMNALPPNYEVSEF